MREIVPRFIGVVVVVVVVVVESKSKSVPLLELEEIGLRGSWFKAVASDVWSFVLLRFDFRFRSTPFSLSSSAKGEGKVARAEGEAEVALERLALARAGEEKDADAGAAAAFSSSSSAAMGAEETMLVFSPWVERRDFFFCSFSLLEPFFLFFELRGGGFKADLFSLSSSAGGEGEVARAEGEAEVALGSSALARAGEEKDADAGAAAAFSSSSSAAMGAGETMSAWGGGLGGLLRFRSALVLSWLRLFIFLLPELRCAGGGQFSLFSSATEKDAAADEGGSLGAAESPSATYPLPSRFSISNRLWPELFDSIYGWQVCFKIETVC